MMSLSTRFWARVGRTGTACWEWSGHLNHAGYGDFNHGHRGVTRLAHRLVYEALVGPIPEGLDIDHLCRNRACVNPAHMEVVTRKVNVLRGESVAAANAAKGACHRGHPYDAANTYLRPDGKGRDCRTCRAEADRRRNRQPARTGRA